MGRHVTKDLSFEVPDGWQDRSIIAYAAPGGGGAKPNVVVTREDLGPGEALRGYADRQLIDIARQLRSFRLVSSGTHTVAGVTAIDLRFVWHADVGPVEQRMLMVAREKQVLTFASTAPEGSSPSAAEVLEALLVTVSFGERPAASPATTPSAPPKRQTMMESALPPGVWSEPSSMLRSVPPPPSPSVAPPPPDPPSAPALPAEAAPSDPACDPQGRARAAAAAHWKVEPDELRATDLHALIPWASRHEIVNVSGGPDRTMVIALGLGDPILFHEGARAAELSRFFRIENIVLPTGLPAHVLAQTIHALLRGKAGSVITQAWLERLRGRLLVEDQDIVLALQRHGEPPRVAPRQDGEDGWELVFASLTPTGGIDRWTVRGDRARLRSVDREEAAPPGSFDLQRWLAPPPAPAQAPSVPPPASNIPRPPPSAGRGGTRIIPVPPPLPKIR